MFGELGLACRCDSYNGDCDRTEFRSDECDGDTDDCTSRDRGVGVRGGDVDSFIAWLRVKCFPFALA